MSMTLEELEKAVAQLPPDKLEEFRAWFKKFDSELWDKQIEQDVLAGKLDKLAEEAIAEHKAGKTRKL